MTILREQSLRENFEQELQETPVASFDSITYGTPEGEIKILISKYGVTASMDEQKAIPRLVLVMAIALILAETTELIPLALPFFLASVLMGYTAYHYYLDGETTNFVVCSAFTGVFLTGSISSISTLSLLPLTILFFIIIIVGIIYGFVS